MLRRAVTAALAVALMGGSAGGYQASWQKESRAALENVQLVHHRDGPCAQIHWSFRPRPERADEIRAAVRRLIRCAVRVWDVPGGAAKALDVAECESGWWPFAVGGSSLGVYQHLARYWLARADQYLRPEWGFGPNPSALNARANIIVTMRLVHSTNSWQLWACA